MIVSTTTLLHVDERTSLLPAKNGWFFELFNDKENTVFLYDASARHWSWLNSAERAAQTKQPYLQPTIVSVEVLGTRVGVITSSYQWQHQAASIVEDYFGVETERIRTDEIRTYKRNYRKHPYTELFSYFPNYAYLYRPRISDEEKKAEAKQIERNDVRRRTMRRLEAIDPHVDKEMRLIYKLGREALIDLELSKSAEGKA